MLRASLSLGLVSILLAACAIPQMEELRSQNANAEFQVSAPLECLYERGVGHVSSYIGMSEPKFTWYIDTSNKAAWFRQPLTLIELRALGPELTSVRRSQTGSAGALGQGSDLLAYLKSNPCSRP